MRVVFDANVVAAGACWRGESYLCLLKLARRQAFAFGTEFTLAETRETTTRLILTRKPQHRAVNLLNWYLQRVRIVNPAHLGKQRSRDASDDHYVAAALGARAQLIVSYDNDLLELEKPFGISILRPAQFLRLVNG